MLENQLSSKENQLIAEQLERQVGEALIKEIIQIKIII